ncbi:MAG: hypothetical protein HY319_09105 [Armatimonadetes bacterium]|nr:hypothetical protein [Armatimonadota bacterium]
MHPYVAAIFALVLLAALLHLPRLVKSWAEFAESSTEGTYRDSGRWPIRRRGIPQGQVDK